MKTLKKDELIESLLEKKFKNFKDFKGGTACSCSTSCGGCGGCRINDDDYISPECDCCSCGCTGGGEC